MKIMFDEYKKYFTLEELERVKAHKAEIEPDEIKGILEVLAAGREELKVKLTWGYNRQNPEQTYFGDGIEICVEAWYFDGLKVVYKHCGFWDICQICNSGDNDNCGYTRTFCESRE